MLILPLSYNLAQTDRGVRPDAKPLCFKSLTAERRRQIRPARSTVSVLLPERLTAEAPPLCTFGPCTMQASPECHPSAVLVPESITPSVDPLHWGSLPCGHRLAYFIVRLLKTIIRSLQTNYKKFSKPALYFANIYETVLDFLSDFGVCHKREASIPRILPYLVLILPPFPSRKVISAILKKIVCKSILLFPSQQGIMAAYSRTSVFVTETFLWQLHASNLFGKGV